MAAIAEDLKRHSTRHYSVSYPQDAGIQPPRTANQITPTRRRYSLTLWESGHAGPDWIPEYVSVRKPLARQRSLTLGNDGRDVWKSRESQSTDRSRPVPTRALLPLLLPFQTGPAQPAVAHRDVRAALETGCFPAPHRGVWGVSPHKCASRAQNYRLLVIS